MLQRAKAAMFLALFVATASLAQAKNVDLSTVPARQGVQLTIYNSEDLTLVRETRKVSFKPGEKAELLYEIVQRQGHNAKQNNVTIEPAAVKP